MLLNALQAKIIVILDYQVFIACKSDPAGYQKVDFWSRTSLKNREVVSLIQGVLRYFLSICIHNCQSNSTTYVKKAVKAITDIKKSTKATLDVKPLKINFDKLQECGLTQFLNRYKTKNGRNFLVMLLTENELIGSPAEVDAQSIKVFFPFFSGNCKST